MGTTLSWAMTLTVALSVAILVVIVASRVLYRGRLTEGGAMWLHLIGLGVLPLGLLAVGNFATLEYAKEERFCDACHVAMAPYVADLTNPHSQSLAALHYQDRFAPGTECYACHADYGLHGTFEAKLTGIRDLYRYATRTYQVPIHMERPYSNGLCLKCHDGARAFMAEESHVEDGRLSPDLASGATPCTECHKRVHAAAGGRPVVSEGATP
jgi:nitrate/TMAO reductase-like tetraheme cytochrome c subunit